MTTEKNGQKTGSDRPAVCNASQSVDGVEPSAMRGEVVLLFPGRAEKRRECDVERINQYAFYDLGKLFKPLGEVTSVVHPTHAFYPVMNARHALLELIERSNPLQLGLSRNPANTLYGSINGLYERYFSEIKDGQRELRFPEANDGAIPVWEWNFMARDLERFETVFLEEMREAATYYVPRRGIYWTPALVDQADETFPDELRAFIPAKALQEWRGAGRCLAFHLLSASGFHVARAVEGVLEAYYQLYSRKPGDTLHSWNDYIEKLEKMAKRDDPRPTPCPTDKTLAELRQMKDDYRNPIMHPRVVLTEADARMLFSNGESLIIAMAQEICEASRSMPPLAVSPPTASPQQAQVP